MSDAPPPRKVCLITGATAGIGAVAAAELARRGMHVVVVGRDPSRCQAVVGGITRDGGSAEFLCGDLSSQAQVRRVAAEFRAKHQRLDVLMNNAGAMFALRRESVDGVEMTLALNHLGYFLLTNLLLDLLRASAPSRVVVVSSSAHADVRGFDFDDPSALHKGYGTSEAKSFVISALLPMAHPGFKQYSMTKLANLLFAFELARRLQGTGVTVNALHPGFVATNFVAGNGALGWFLRLWASLFAISPERGAQTMVHLAASPQVEGVTGQYFVKERQATPSAAARDEAAARRQWELSEQMTTRT